MRWLWWIRRWAEYAGSRQDDSCLGRVEILEIRRWSDEVDDEETHVERRNGSGGERGARAVCRGVDGHREGAAAARSCRSGGSEGGYLQLFAGDAHGGGRHDRHVDEPRRHSAQRGEHGQSFQEQGDGYGREVFVH